MSILITGVTGNTGRPLAALLRERGADVRGACRNPGSGGVRFDWTDPSTHVPAVAGVERIYLVPPPATIDAMPVVEPFLELARAAGVRRVVLLGSLAALADSSEVSRFYSAVRDMPEWVVLRPSGFMQNFTGSHAVATGIRERGEIRTAAGAGRMGWIDAEDIAAVAAAVLLDPAEQRVEHILTGPEALSYAAAGAVIAEFTGRPVRLVDVPVAEVLRRHVDSGLPAEFAAKLATFDENIRAGTEDVVTSTVRDLTGRPARTFRDFVRNHPEWAAAPV